MFFSGLLGMRLVKEFTLGKQRSFVCTICDSQCDLSAIQTHLIGSKHRMRYLVNFLYFTFRFIVLGCKLVIYFIVFTCNRCCLYLLKMKIITLYLAVFLYNWDTVTKRVRFKEKPEYVSFYSCLSWDLIFYCLAIYFSILYALSFWWWCMCVCSEEKILKINSLKQKQ